MRLLYGRDLFLIRPWLGHSRGTVSERVIDVRPRAPVWQRYASGCPPGTFLRSRIVSVGGDFQCPSISVNPGYYGRAF